MRTLFTGNEGEKRPVTLGANNTECVLTLLFVVVVVAGTFVFFMLLSWFEFWFEFWFGFACVCMTWDGSVFGTLCLVLSGKNKC